MSGSPEPDSPETESPVAKYLIKYFVRSTVKRIIGTFEVYNVSDLRNITNAQIEQFQRSGGLSWGEGRMLKHIVNFHKTGSQQVGTQGSNMSLMKDLLHQLKCIS
jgi:hypothetical protein